MLLETAFSYFFIWILIFNLLNFQFILVKHSSTTGGQILADFVQFIFTFNNPSLCAVSTVHQSMSLLTKKQKIHKIHQFSKNSETLSATLLKEDPSRRQFKCVSLTQLSRRALLLLKCTAYFVLSKVTRALDLIKLYSLYSIDFGVMIWDLGI